MHCQKVYEYQIPVPIRKSRHTRIIHKELMFSIFMSSSRPYGHWFEPSQAQSSLASEVESEDCRAVALAKADVLSPPTQAQRATTRQAILRFHHSELEIDERHGTCCRKKFERQKCANVCWDLNTRRWQCQPIN